MTATTPRRARHPNLTPFPPFRARLAYDLLQLSILAHHLDRRVLIHLSSELGRRRSPAVSFAFISTKFESAQLRTGSTIFGYFFESHLNKAGTPILARRCRSVVWSDCRRRGAHRSEPGLVL
jgi:hypothetical protein